MREPKVAHQNADGSCSRQSAEKMCIRDRYKVMKQLGFREGNILEPACGIGHFIGMLPEEMKESKIYGVELDLSLIHILQGVP